MKSYRLRPLEVERRWFHVDATDQVLGRLAVKVARVLMGKEDPRFTPGVDGGDFVVVTGARNVRVTGNKEDKKVYRYHTGWIGHLREQSLAQLRDKKPEKIVQHAVRRMLPKNKLGRAMYKRLKVYGGEAHPHGGQAPAKLEVPAAKRDWHATTTG